MKYLLQKVRELMEAVMTLDLTYDQDLVELLEELEEIVAEEELNESTDA
jgi:hypothetical protein